MPEIKTLEIQCDDCSKVAERCLCDHCFEEKMSEEYERGVEDGKITGRDEAEEEFKKDEE